MFEQLFAALTPMLISAIGAALTIIIKRLADAASHRWGIEVEARHREALHSALMSGVRAALTRGLEGGDVVDAAISHAEDSVPDALAALAPEAAVLASIAHAKLLEAIENENVFEVGG